MKNISKALTIAGSDSSGGAGIQADLKTMTSLNVFGMSAITALTAQNTMGVIDIMEVTPEFLEKQLDAVFQDIYPDAVKIGMVANPDLIKVIAKTLKKYDAKNIVIDPVMVATSGSKLMANESIETIKTELFPLGMLITPNIYEASMLSGINVDSKMDMIEAAKIISGKHNIAVLCKGGHSLEDADDLLYVNGIVHWYKGDRIDNKNTHGTGCTISSAITSYLAKGEELEEAVRLGKEYITKAIDAQLDLGHGSGPLYHMFNVKE